MANANLIETAAKILSTAPKAPAGQRFGNIQGWNQGAIYRANRKAGFGLYEASSASIMYRVARRAEELR